MKLFKEVPENDGVHYESLSPTELAGILRGDSWVLAELEKEIEVAKRHIAASWTFLEVTIEHLESQAPISELAEQAKEDGKKAEAWDKLQN